MLFRSGYMTWRETGSSVQERVTERLERIELNKIAAKREKTLKNEHLREGGVKDYTETAKGPGSVANVPYSKSSCPRCRAG